jgi:hypothetical protein
MLRMIASVPWSISSDVIAMPKVAEIRAIQYA